MSLVCCPIVGPVAFFVGNSSLNRIRGSGGTLGGEGLAQAGRILGILGSIWLVIQVLLGILYVVGIIAASSSR